MEKVGYLAAEEESNRCRDSRVIAPKLRPILKIVQVGALKSTPTIGNGSADSVGALPPPPHHFFNRQ